MIKIRTILYALVMLVAASCLDPYDPPSSGAGVGLLVVDGFLNSGNKSVSVKLSTARGLADINASPAVTNAVVTVEGDDGTLITIPETSAGVYAASALTISTGKNYQLRIKTAGKEYLSKLMQLKKSPVLDSINWRLKDDGVTIYVDSHDETGSTKYYQWAFTETFEYNADLFTALTYDKARNVVRARTDAELVFTCYTTQNSTRVLITSTETNTQDVVNDFELMFIPKGSIKLRRMYSILVQQRALDADAYNYWKNLQRTTENLGGLFDPLPSEVTGNVRNVNDANEPVLGYFGGGEVQEKRLFIDYQQLPANFHTYGYSGCETYTLRPVEVEQWKGTELYIISANGTAQIDSYNIGSQSCSDCRTRGGVVQKPSFWPSR